MHLPSSHLPHAQRLTGHVPASHLPFDPPRVPQGQLPLGLAPTGDFALVRERVRKDALDKWDALTPRAEIRLHHGRVWFPEAAQSDFAASLRPTSWATSQFCQRLGIPAAYFKKCPAPAARPPVQPLDPAAVRGPGGAAGGGRRPAFPRPHRRGSAPRKHWGRGPGRAEPVRDLLGPLAAADEGGRPAGRAVFPLRPARRRPAPGLPRAPDPPGLRRGLVLARRHRPAPAPGGPQKAAVRARRRRPALRRPRRQQRGGPAGRDGGRAGVPAGLPERADPAGEREEPAAPAARLPLGPPLPGGAGGGGAGGLGRGGSVPGADPGGRQDAGPGRSGGACAAGASGGVKQGLFGGRRSAAFARSRRGSRRRCGGLPTG